MTEKNRICIIGAGAIGGVVAGLLKKAGHDITLVTRHPDSAALITATGIKVSGFRGEFTIQIPATAKTEELEGSFDYVLIVTKADGLQAAARDILPFIHDQSRVVSMQNGICEDLLAEIVGNERTVGCVVGWGGTMHAPGVVEMTSGGEFIVGNWGRGKDESLEQLSHILSDVIECRSSDEIYPELYSKLIINSCITTLGAVCGLYLGEMLAMKKARRLFIEIIREAMKVAEAMDLEVPPGASGKLDYYNFLKPGPVAELKRHIMLRVIGLKYRRLKSSSLQSLERGRPTEIDHYNGYIAAKGKEHKVSCPVNQQLTDMVHEIERGSRQISPANFGELDQA